MTRTDALETLRGALPANEDDDGPVTVPASVLREVLAYIQPADEMHKVNVGICEALALDPSRLRGLTIELRKDDWPLIETRGRVRHGDDLEGELRQHVLIAADAQCPHCGELFHEPSSEAVGVDESAA